MTERLEIDDRFPERPRRELDRQLDVALWRVPDPPWHVPGTPRRTPRDRDEPAWWSGDEDASQSFLAAVGVVT